MGNGIGLILVLMTKWGGCLLLAKSTVVKKLGRLFKKGKLLLKVEAGAVYSKHP